MHDLRHLLTGDTAGSEHDCFLSVNPEYEAFGNPACSGHRNFSLGPCRVVLNGRKLVDAYLEIHE
jgi:hypothetical protein